MAALPCLVGDEEAARGFLAALQAHGPSAESPKCFYFQLLAREKYGSTMPRIMFRRLVELDKLVDAVYDATPARGFYFNGPVSLDSMVVYFTPEPRDCETAAKHLCSQFIMRSELEKSKDVDFAHDFLSEVQKHPYEKRILDIDLDNKSKFNSMKAFLAENDIRPRFVIESRGGFHFLCYDLTKEKQRDVHTFCRALGEVDLLKNSMIPLPGTLQGGFLVKWLKDFDPVIPEELVRLDFKPVQGIFCPKV